LRETAESQNSSRTRTFQLAGKLVEVTYVPALWRVRAGKRSAESRILDEALEQVLGRSATLVNLTVEILAWALGPEPD
jgi:hypothetical protein